MRGACNRPLLRRLFAAPRLLQARLPSEIIPHGLTSLELDLDGWGWVQLEGPKGIEPRIHFWREQFLTLFVPAGSCQVLRVGNFWGTSRYQIDATTLRSEVWVPHESNFRLQLPVSAKVILPLKATSLPSDQWRAARVDTATVIHWPMARLEPRRISPLSLPGSSLPTWKVDSPMQGLQERLDHFRLPN